MSKLKPLQPLQPLLPLFDAAGQPPPRLSDVAHIVADGERILSSQALPGLTVATETRDDGIHARIEITAGTRVASPIHLCFGLYAHGRQQRVHLELLLAPGAEATLLSHCLFAVERPIIHSMTSRVHLMKGARLNHQQAHFHGDSGQAAVTPYTEIQLDTEARYLSDFSLLKGRVGQLNIGYRIDAGERACAELRSRIFARAEDRVRLDERLVLNGRDARGLIKSRVAVCDRAQAEVYSEMAGNAPGSRGHVDCLEIVRDQAQVSAVPKVRVSDPLAKVTHEAAIGSVDNHQLESLMARGLSPDDAVDMIIRGALRRGPDT